MVRFSSGRRHRQSSEVRRRGQGVRSVGDVFNLIVTENRMLAGVLSGTPNTGAKPVPITDPEKLQEALKASYVSVCTKSDMWRPK
jgi:hypothetical protein